MWRTVVGEPMDPEPAARTGTSFMLVPSTECLPVGLCIRVLTGTPNREPEEYRRNKIEYKDLGRYIPVEFLLYSWCSLFGVPSKVPSSGTWHIDL